MPETEILLRILLSIAFGTILGLETETREIAINGNEVAKNESKQRIGGLRTYTVISLFGGISGLLYLEKAYILVYITFVAITLFLLVAYFSNIQLKKAFGVTTEIAILITFLIGFLTTSALLSLSVVLVIIILLTFFLSQKRGLGSFIERIQHKELIDLIKLGLISLVILPFLPNQNYMLGDFFALTGLSNLGNSNISNIPLINPFQIWLIVVFVSGINLLGYILSKFIGKARGLFVTGVFGGIISSTSTLISLAHRSKSKGSSDHYNLLGGVSLIANSTSFLTVATLSFLASRSLFVELLPILIVMSVSGFLIGIIFMRLDKNNNSKDTSLGLVYEPFTIIPALKFVGIIIFITLFVQILRAQNVDPLLLVGVTALTGVTGIDTSVIALSVLVESGSISLGIAVIGFLMANIVNFIAKAVYAHFFGSGKFVQVIVIGLFIISILSIIVRLI